MEQRNFEKQQLHQVQRAVNTIRQARRNLGLPVEIVNARQTHEASYPIQHEVFKIEQSSLRERQNLCPQLIKSENYWKISLALALAEARGEVSQVKALTMDVDLPLTTTLRTLQSMEEDGLIERTKRVNDQRVTLINLTNKSREALFRWAEFKAALMSQLQHDDEYIANRTPPLEVYVIITLLMMSWVPLVVYLML